MNVVLVVLDGTLQDIPPACALDMRAVVRAGREDGRTALPPNSGRCRIESVDRRIAGAEKGAQRNAPDRGFPTQAPPAFGIQPFLLVSDHG